MSLKRLTIPVCLLTMAAPHAHGAGLELNQHGVKELSHGFAGTATLLEDASAIAHNPAGLTRLEGHQFSGGVTALYADIDYDVEVRREKVENRFGLEPRTVAGGGDANSKSVTPVPHLYYGHKVNEDTAIGVGIYAPFGSGSEFPDNQWAGRYHAVETEQSTVNINPTISVNLTDSISLGLGAVIQSYEATLTNQIDLGYLVAESVINELSESERTKELVSDILEEAEAVNRTPDDPSRVNKADVNNEIEMDSIGYGFSFGLLWEVRDDTRVGFNYRSRVQHVATGDIERPNLDDAGKDIEEALSNLAKVDEEEAAEGRQAATGKLGAAPGDINSRVTFPDIATLSVHHDLTDRLALMGSFSYINWSLFDEIRLEYEIDSDGTTADESIDDPSTRGGEDLVGGEDLRRRDLVQPLEFSDTMRYGLGARYQYNERVVLRTGASYDESPLSDSDFRTPRGPDNDRIILGFGASYQANEDMMVDVGYAYTRIKEADVSAQENPAGTLHRAVGTTRTNIHSLGLQANYNF